MVIIKLKILQAQLESMFSLDNISVNQFFQLEEGKAKEYIQLQSMLNPKNSFQRKKLNTIRSLSFEEVGELKRCIINPTYHNLINAFKIVFKVKEIQIVTSDIISFFYALKWIQQEVKTVFEKEKQLIPTPDADMENAGATRLAAFGEMSTLINLGKKFSIAPQEIAKWSYNIVYAILLYEKVENEVQKKYMKLKSNKNGRKR